MKCKSSKPFVKHLYDALKADGSFEPLMDTESLEEGEHWRPALIEMLGSCQVAVVVLSEPALESPWVLQEVTALKFRHDYTGDLLLLPVYIGGLSDEQVATSEFAPLSLKDVQAFGPGPTITP